MCIRTDSKILNFNGKSMEKVSFYPNLAISEPLQDIIECLSAKGPDTWWLKHMEKC